MKEIDVNKMQYRTAYGVILLKKNDLRIKALEDSSIPEIHGHKIWNSSFLIMDHLRNNPLKPGSHVTEIGCGWGTLSVYCAKIQQAKVVGVDADKHVFPYLQAHAQVNDVKIKTLKRKYQQLKKAELASQDLIVGADICFWDDLTDALFQVVKRAMNAGVAEVLIADPGRSPFYKLAKKCKKEFNAQLLDRSVADPVRYSGHLLTVRAN